MNVIQFNFHNCESCNRSIENEKEGEQKKAFFAAVVDSFAIRLLSEIHKQASNNL